MAQTKNNPKFDEIVAALKTLFGGDRITNEQNYIDSPHQKEPMRGTAYFRDGNRQVVYIIEINLSNPEFSFGLINQDEVTFKARRPDSARPTVEKNPPLSNIFEQALYYRSTPKDDAPAIPSWRARADRLIEAAKQIDPNFQSKEKFYSLEQDKGLKETIKRQEIHRKHEPPEPPEPDLEMGP